MRVQVRYSISIRLISGELLFSGEIGSTMIIPIGVNLITILLGFFFNDMILGGVEIYIKF
ncbi:hypothetical protein BDV32DRAFT_45327 [Aspergillus pseudonomiae]|nr:hypothetical protein BDV32DRAFT_45327 [Aspergillus pseudonomiae]